MKLADCWSGIFWLLLALWVIVESFQFGFGLWKSPGAGFVPLWAGVLLASLSLFQIFRAIGKRIPSAGENPFKEVRWEKWGLTLAALLGYGLLLEPLGFLLCTLIFMAILLALVEPQPWSVVLLTALGTTAASYLIFEWWLKSQLPKGLLGI
jgi:putative tricarboxylic transport membrane protein